jgi:hypothetical protein
LFSKLLGYAFESVPVFFVTKNIAIATKKPNQLKNKGNKQSNIRLG